MIQTAVIVAGGKGTRMGANKPKQFLELAARPILVHTIDRFLNLSEIDSIVLVLPKAEQAAWEILADSYFSSAEADRIILTTGGKLRTHSVHNGLQALETRISQTEDCLVAIHDGVRPFLTTEMLAQAYRTAESAGASVTCVKVKASLREVDEKGNSLAVDRTRFLEVQTPQTFRLDTILTAYQKRPHDRFTDDASLYETVFPNNPVVVCKGNYDNIKITTPEDMFVAEQIWERFIP